jgi:lipopolysaccharide transport system ATP-binding protein
MSHNAIEVKNLSKVYNIGHERKGLKGTATLRDALTNFARKPTEIFTGHRLRKEHFWALEDVNFEVKPGDVVGIIGKNGSGKSTLLKILSRIIEPTTGEIHMRGKVASLLEVGTGFHPELTGRENIFFNGAILGMKRKEILSKFDEIVAFSEVEQFLDTPVKFYSSGMYVRLAFAVAAHLDPDILIVDEVLAVGDAAFQKKSLGKMKNVAQSGRTVLFVSHNMDSVRAMCSQGIYFESGKIVAHGKIDAVVKAYAKHTMELSTRPLDERKDRQGSGRAVITNCTVINAGPRLLKIAFSYINKSGTIENIKVSVAIRDQEGSLITNLTNTVQEQRIDLLPKKGTIVLEVPNFNLESGDYLIDTFMATDDQNSEILDFVEGAVVVNVNNSSFYSSRVSPPTRGSLLFDFKFEAEEA